MHLFIDTNILLDVFLHRSGHDMSLAILRACVLPGNSGWIAWHTLSNGFYIVQRETKSLTAAKRFASELLLWANVAEVGTAEAIAAEQRSWDDLEDAMQVAAAEACQADVIITRNILDFAGSPIAVFTPEEFLAQYEDAIQGAP